MIAYLNGRLVHKDPTHVLLEVNGIGYEVKISLNTYAALKDREQCKLLTWLHIKEDAHTLYGFQDGAEKRLFLHLISVSGVGPGTALMMLSSLKPAEIESAIIHDDARTLSAVKGIGAKTAQRLILELRDKVLKGEVVSPSTASLSPASHNTTRQEALSALVTLGINRAAAEKNLDSILKQHGTTLSLEELIKLALKNA
ncbi:Holliday junction branch migration protein RuvA [Cesiribacter andamanensis]|uniref:Holliday junction branch migration complex subunit RuvA n=1 Tax=Cesiribacter andamanensis AMV16 TaxID=1279009 RepID=M7NS66_9BACT|nr:Holliday junction branch migration protein RuvA [Cesiribacter andamanensis]EMR04545.1 Holliday junction ATP-dependent DNA helicase RuvA [Cesiribacter andamanensis AMV16]